MGMSDTQDLIRVGVVGRAHGIKGAVRVFMDEPTSDSLLRVPEVYLGGARTCYKVLQSHRCGRFMALELDGITDRDAAFERTGEEVFVRRSALKPLRHAYYACDLKGLQIVDETGKSWGVIDDVVPSGAHDMLHYRTQEGCEGFVPFVSAHVGDVDLKGGTVTVESGWMAELDAIYKKG